MKQKNNSINNREFWFGRTPEFFNVKFQLLTYAIDGIFLLYSIISIPLYIFYHIFGDLGLFLEQEKTESSPSLTDEYMQNYKLNDNSLLWNLFNIVIPIGFIFFSQKVIKVQTYAFFSVYMGILKILIFAYFMNINLTLLSNKSSFIFKIFNWMLIFIYNIYLIYSIHFYLKNKNKTNNNNTKSDKDTSYGKYKININEHPASIDTIVHEVQLRIDMVKMKFNSIMIKWKLNKIFKKLMYQPSDFYFMQKNREKERQNEHIIRNIKGFKNVNKSDGSRSQMSDNISSTNASSIDNNYSRLEEDENEPLKM